MVVTDQYIQDTEIVSMGDSRSSLGKVLSSESLNSNENERIVGYYDR